MDIKGTTVLVTGANRGLGKAFAQGLIEAGAAKVYAAARNPESITTPGVVPVKLDVTDPEGVKRLAKELVDVDLVVNNAGIGHFAPLLATDGIETLRRQFETNAVGPLRVVAEFAPILANNGGGAVVNMLSVLSWLTMSGTGGYSASKAAGWALTNALRQELKAQGTAFLAVHAAFIDTDMASGVPGPKSSPQEIVRQVLEALEAGQTELLADEITRSVHAGLVAEPRVYTGA